MVPSSPPAPVTGTRRGGQVALLLLARASGLARDFKRMTKYAAEQQTRAALLDSQRRVLERIANGAPLGEILETLVRLKIGRAHV